MIFNGLYRKQLGCSCSQKSAQMQGTPLDLLGSDATFWDDVFKKRADGKRVFTSVIEIDLKSSLLLTGALVISGLILKKI